ncbi:polysaccharide deacetylase family protein [Ferrimicrobium acidiphilum]|uniref:polysaccharide deacetylase family protein n=1 Tax=Ferrimicrobium acidiphilum TaxID=121039 RepID=UPI0023F31122|nr:polysaccharide deacetylase family protein [Ferrimicrobium acidiphilum]
MTESRPIGTERDLVGYAGEPPMGVWPGGRSLAVNIAINVEEGAERSPLYGDASTEGLGEMPRAIDQTGTRDLATESVYEYGARVGCARLIRLLGEREISATAFVAARAVEHNHWLAEVLKSPSIEICGHGYRWAEAWGLSRDREAAEIRRAVQVLGEIFSAPPVGWYDRWMPSVANRELLVEIGGFLYDSNAYNDDTPYYVRVRDQNHLVVPYSLTYNDAHFSYGTFGSPSNFVELVSRGIRLLQNEARLDGRLRMLSIGVHPRISGQAGRASALEEILDLLAADPSIWVATRRQIAEFWFENIPPSL